MNRSDFYNDRNKERKINFLSGIRLVRRYFCRKYDISQTDMELLWRLHDLEKFIREDFLHAAGLASWDAGRFKKLLENDWIKVWRKRAPSKGQRYNIYCLTYKAKSIINDTYKILCGEMEIPTSKRANPIMKRETYNDKVYANEIDRFNEAMRALREK